MSRRVRVTIVLEYDSESTLLEADTSYAAVDEQAYKDGHLTLGEIVSWVPTDADLKAVAFEQA